MTGKDNWCQHLTLTNSAVVMTNNKVLTCITAELSFVKMYLSLFRKLLMDTYVTKVLIGMLKVAINIPMHAFIVKWVFNSCVHITKDTVGEWMVTRICSFYKKLATSLLKELNFGNFMLWASAPIVSPHRQSELAVVDILRWGHSNWRAVHPCCLFNLKSSNNTVLTTFSCRNSTWNSGYWAAKALKGKEMCNLNCVFYTIL